MRQPKIIIYILFVLLFSFPFTHAHPVEIRILHINDFHGFAEPYKPLGSDLRVGGLPYLATRVKELRQEKPTLLLSAGDMIQGNNWANLFYGESVIEWMNEMKFDAMVLGNHEFDFGHEVLRKRISEATFPVLGANVNGLNDILPYIMKELTGIKIAIIGIVTEDVPLSTHPRNVVGLKFTSPIETVRKIVETLKNNVDVILVLSHIGFSGDRVLAEKVKGIDVIVGGHSHTKIERPQKVGNTLIVQAWEHGKALGVLDLTLKDRRILDVKGRLEEIRPERGREDRATSMIVKKYEERMNALLNEKIGEAEVDLDGENVRRRETNLGNFVSDIMRRVSGAEVTLINGGGIRSSIRRGEVRVKDVYSALPFDNYIVAIKLTGRQIQEALDHGVSGVEDEEGRFPQVSGLTFKYSPSEKKGSRVKEIRISGQPIEHDKEYVVATNDFLAAGGDGYRVFGEAIRSSKDFSIIGGMMKGEKVVYSHSGKWLRDVVVDTIKDMKKIFSEVEGRIQEIR